VDADGRVERRADEPTLPATGSGLVEATRTAGSRAAVGGIGQGIAERAARAWGMGAPVRDRGRYVILGEHGRGGLGRVLRAHDRELGRDVAIKELISRGELLDGATSLWSLDAGAARYTLRSPHGAITAVAFAADAGRPVIALGALLRMFCPDNRWFAAISDHGDRWFHRAAEDRRVHLPTGIAKVSPAAFSDDGRQCVASDPGGRALVVDMTSAAFL